MKEDNKINEDYIEELEDKIVELSLKVKSKDNELKSINSQNSLIFKKLIHNLKNPVGVAFSFSDMILEGIDSYTTEKLEKHVTIIKKSSKFSVDLLNKFAEFYRYLDTDLTYDFQLNNYVSVINKVVEDVSEYSALKGVKIETKFSSPEINFNFDKIEIGVAIKNILNNAIRYSCEGTIITVEVLKKNNSIETTITDQGIGISEEDLPNILTPFYVVNTYSTDKEKCIGLGLPISNKIIQNHKGKIIINSVVEKGSIFKIIL